MALEKAGALQCLTPRSSHFPLFLVSSLTFSGENERVPPRHFEAHVKHIDVMAADNIVLLGGEFPNAIVLGDRRLSVAHLLTRRRGSRGRQLFAGEPRGDRSGNSSMWHLVGITPAWDRPSVRANW